MARAAGKKRASKSKTYSPEEKARRALQRKHRTEIRGIFETVGFSRVDGATDKEFTFDGCTSDFDDIFVLENIIVLAEYTTTRESEISSHAKRKYILYDRIKSKSENFVEYIKGAPLNVASKIDQKYHNHQCRVVILYCSYNFVSSELKDQINHAVFMDYSVVRYFKLLTATVKKSAKSELLSFLSIGYNEFSDRAIQNNPSARQPFQGSVLPEAHSNFPDGYKVVSFYIDPAALMARAYVLRRDGWRDRTGLYQRMIIKSKIDSVRRYLIETSRVFVNNIIVTLPSSTKVVDDNEDTINPSHIKNTRPATISIPYDFNSIGLIDGQHRVFSYFEGGGNEARIAELRSQQNLLVTGIIYPPNVSAEEKTRFEANLFLEINSNQANAKSDLKQAINQIIRPFVADSIARDVLDILNDGDGALGNKFARQYFETDVLKTTSVVSYGIKPLVRPSVPGPIFSRWDDEAKLTFISSEDDKARLRYVEHCANQIAIFVSAAKSRLPSALWTTDRKVDNRLITPTVINGLVGSMRQAIDAGVEMEFESLRHSFTGLANFDFQKYKSSQYTVMATDIFRQFFAKQTSTAAMSEERVVV